MSDIKHKSTPNKASLVSVVITTYNRCDLVRQALASVRAQTYPEIQIIVVDDGSTDSTEEVIGGMSDIKYIRQKNSGQANARNHGLKYAEGAYISLLDSDDLWHPTFLQRCVEAIDTLDADFVFSNWIAMGANGASSLSYFEKFYHWWDFSRTQLVGWRIMLEHPARAMYTDSCVSPSSAVLYRRECLTTPCVETIKIGDDWCLQLDIVLNKSCRVGFTMEHLWTKRVQGDNICDERDFIEVTKYLYLHDMNFMLNRFDSVMTKSERARLLGQLAISNFAMARYEFGGRRIQSTLKYMMVGLSCLQRGLVNNPASALAKLYAQCRPYMPVTPPEAELNWRESLGIQRNSGLKATPAGTSGRNAVAPP